MSKITEEEHAAADDARDLRSEIAEWEDDEDFFEGDRGYQSKCERLSELEERLEELERERHEKD